MATEPCGPPHWPSTRLGQRQDPPLPSLLPIREMLHVIHCLPLLIGHTLGSKVTGNSPSRAARDSNKGIHDVSYYSVDSYGDSESARNLTLTIDWLDEPCPGAPPPSAGSDPEPPPYYVVINGQQDCLNRNGSSCSPFVLGQPECTSCATCNVDVQSELCEPYLTGVVPEGQTETLYEMCQAGTRWTSRVRTLDSLGNCPVRGTWISDPPGTGVDLPTTMPTPVKEWALSLCRVMVRAG